MKEEDKANARLIAAAPDMLKALERISKAKPDGLDHAVDIAIIERAAKIASAAIATLLGSNR